MKKTLISVLFLSLVLNVSSALPAGALPTTGPGNRIHGVDISRWQHPSGKPINFTKMYRAGVRFIWIKGADSHDPADATAFKYLKLDRPAAQAAGLYTGIYYYAYLPDSTKPDFVIADAKAQAQKAIWRLSSVGGYTVRDLPIALDIENNCVRPAANGNCAKYTTKQLVTLWTQTWLDTVASATSKKPFVYSYAAFLQNAMLRTTSLTKYPLWIAAYTKTPAVTSPGTKVVGCFAHAWSKANCSAQWQFWQYTSCGIGAKYGVPSDRVDLNVYSGSDATFYALTAGTWEPDLSDLLPVNETTTIQLVSSTMTTTDKPATFVVDVFRPDGTPVVTGDVSLKVSDSSTVGAIQKTIRSATGRWTLNITSLKAGLYQGLIEFADPTGTHATSDYPVQFAIAQGPIPTPSPSPKPSPSPTKKPKPIDTCAGQIRN